VVEEGRVHGLADGIVAAEAEGDVGDAAADLGVREVGLDPARGLDEIDGVVVVLLDAGADGEDVRVEDDVLRREAGGVHQQAVGTLADANLLGVGGGLAVLVEGHDDHGGAVAEDGAGLLEELRLALLEGDGVDDALALKAFQAGLDDLPLGGVHHDRNLGDLGLARDEVQEARHGRDAVDQAVVHAHVDDVGAVVHLLAGDGDGLLVVAGLDELGELRRAGDVGALANHEERARHGREGEGTGEGELGLEDADLAGRLGPERLGDGRDVLGGVAAAAAGDVEQAAVGELAHEARHVGGFQVEAGFRERIGQAGVGVGGNKDVGLRAQFLEEGAHEVGADGAVEADGEGLVRADGIPERPDGLRRDHRLAAAADGGRDHEREADIVLGENLLDGDERGLGVEGVEDGLDQQQVHAAGEERAHLAAVVGLHLVEGDDPETRVVGVGRIGERDGQRPDGAGDVAAAAGGVGDAVGPGAALLRGLEVDVVRQLLEELVLDDALVERRILATAFLARVLDEELALADAGRRKRVGLDDIGAGLKEAAVDVADLGRSGEGVDVAVVLEVLGGILEAVAARLRLGDVVGTDGRAHGAINDGDALG
jgi:hypothetical protein